MTFWNVGHHPTGHEEPRGFQTKEWYDLTLVAEESAWLDPGEWTRGVTSRQRCLETLTLIKGKDDVVADTKLLARRLER